MPVETKRKPAPLSPKAPEMESFLESFATQAFGKSRQSGACVFCADNRILAREDFRNELSWKEFGISRLCQKCQDQTFEIENTRDDTGPTGICPNCSGYTYEGKTCCSEKCEKEYIAYVNAAAF